MRALGELLVSSHWDLFGQESGYQPLLFEVAHIYESVHTDLIAKQGDVDAKVDRMGLLREAKRLRDGGIITGHSEGGATAKTTAAAAAGGGPGKTAVVALDPTRFARSGALLAALASRADKEGIALYTTFVDACGAELIARGALIPAGVTEADFLLAGRPDFFFASGCHLTTLPALRRFFMLPGGWATLAFTCIASGDTADPAPAGNIAWAVQVAVQGCLAVLMTVRSFSFLSHSSGPLLQGRSGRSSDYKAAVGRMSPSGTVHTKLFNHALRLDIVGALHRFVFIGGRHRIPGIAHLGESAAAATAATIRGDKSARVRTMAVGYLALLPKVTRQLMPHLAPTVYVFAGAAPIYVPPSGNLADIRHNWVVKGDLIQVRMLSIGDAPPTLWLLDMVADVNSSPEEPGGRGPPFMCWRGDVYLRPRDIRVGTATGKVGLVFRPELYPKPDVIDNGGTAEDDAQAGRGGGGGAKKGGKAAAAKNIKPDPDGAAKEEQTRVAVRVVVRVGAGRPETDELFPPPGVPPLEIVLAWSSPFRQRSGPHPIPAEVHAIPAATAAGLQPFVSAAGKVKAKSAARGGRSEREDTGYGGGKRPRHK